MISCVCVFYFAAVALYCVIVSGICTVGLAAALTYYFAVEMPLHSPFHPDFRVFYTNSSVSAGTSGNSGVGTRDEVATAGGSTSFEWSDHHSSWRKSSKQIDHPVPHGKRGIVSKEGQGSTSTSESSPTAADCAGKATIKHWDAEANQWHTVTHGDEVLNPFSTR